MTIPNYILDWIVYYFAAGFLGCFMWMAFYAPLDDEGMKEAKKIGTIVAGVYCIPAVVPLIGAALGAVVRVLFLTPVRRKYEDS